MKAIDGNTTVRDLLTAFPQAADIMIAHGMCADCRSDPPAVPLHHFAKKHCDGNLPDLLDELAAVRSG